jgi:hypothetical protein
MRHRLPVLAHFGPAEPLPNVGYQGKSGSDSDIVKQSRLTPTGHYLHLPAHLFDASSGPHIH